MVSESYNALGNTAEAEKFKRLAFDKYSNSLSVKKINNPVAENNKNKNPEATQLYQKIYNLYLSGNYQEAYNTKKQADEKFGTTYWSPQLLYIQAVYQAKISNDSAALQSLNDLISLYPDSKMVSKAESLIEAIKNRKAITGQDVKQKPINKPAAAVNNKVNPPQKEKTTVGDTTTKPTNVTPSNSLANNKQSDVSKSGYITEKSPLSVFIYLTELDALYARETKLAVNRFNREQMSNQSYSLDLQVLEGKNQYLTVDFFLNDETAFNYINKLKSYMKNELIWLPEKQYEILFITSKNLDNLKQKKDIGAYREWLKQNYPGKF
jgi:hypothetical protein